MEKSSQEYVIAEQYLKEMLKADDSGDFDLYVKRYEETYLKGFTRERFLNDIQSMRERNGLNKGYEFLGALRNANYDGLNIFRSVWRGIYEKRDAVIEIALYRKSGVWYLIQSSVH